MKIAVENAGRVFFALGDDSLRARGYSLPQTIVELLDTQPDDEPEFRKASYPMCDVIIRRTENANLSECCIRGSRHVCRNAAKCPNLWTDFGATETRLCNFHVSFCRYCGRTYCPECIAPHEAACSMRPNDQTYVPLREVVQKALAKMGL